MRSGRTRHTSREHIDYQHMEVTSDTDVRQPVRSTAKATSATQSGRGGEVWLTSRHPHVLLHVHGSVMLTEAVESPIASEITASRCAGSWKLTAMSP